MVEKLTGKQVLVTGATGFIGGRLVERMILETGAHVRALVRDYRTSVWLSRTSAEIVLGDITDAESLVPALEGCEIVFHCAALMGGDPELMHHVNVQGTENLLAAAARAGASRFVHMSSLAVHGQHYRDGADETSPFKPVDAYAKTKLASEQLALRFCEDKSLAVVVVRPTIVYGPRSQWWTVDPIQRIKKNRLALLGRGQGVANVVYVDDVVTALLLAATAPGIEGETFLISSQERATWREFFGSYAQMCRKSLPRWPRPAAQVITAVMGGLNGAIDGLLGTRERAERMRLWALVFLRGIRKVSSPLSKLARWELAMYGPKAQVSTAKAARLLGYRSEWPLSRAMVETEKWLRLQGYVT